MITLNPKNLHPGPMVRLMGSSSVTSVLVDGQLSNYLLDTCAQISNISE